MKTAARILLLGASYLSAGAQTLPPRKPPVFTVRPESPARLGATPLPRPWPQFIPLLPLIHRDRTVFSSKLRLPAADLLGGRLHFDVFGRQLSPNAGFRDALGLSPALRMSPAGQTQRSDKSLGINLSFRFGRKPNPGLHALAPYVKVP